MEPHYRKRLEKWRSFMAGDSRDGFMFHVNFPLPEWEARLPPAVPLYPEKARERVEYNWAGYELMCRKARLVDDDRIPYLSNVTGTEIFAEAFGCRVHRPDDTMPFALPLIQAATEADRLRQPELGGSSLACLFDIADELHRRGGPGAVMKPVDIQSPMDVVALIWDKSDLFVAMLEAPDAVRALTAKVRRLLEDFFNEWCKRYGTTFVAHYPDYVMHGGITMSVDEVGSVSKEMFGEFFRDELACLSRRFGGIGIHCCADARHQWGNFREIPGLKLINHNAPPARNARNYLLDALRFYGDRVAQMPVGWTPDGPPDTWPAQFPEGTRVVFEVQAEDAARAAAIASRLQELRQSSAAVRSS